MCLQHPTLFLQLCASVRTVKFPLARSALSYLFYLAGHQEHGLKTLDGCSVDIFSANSAVVTGGTTAKRVSAALVSLTIWISGSI